MALTLLQKKKMQQGLIIVLLVVLLITAGVLWLGFFRGKQGERASVVRPEAAQGQQPQTVQINFDVLSLPLLQELDDPAEPVQEPLIKGRNNPFLPFEP